MRYGREPLFFSLNDGPAIADHNGMRDPVLLVTVIEELDDVRTPDVVELATEIAELLVRIDARTSWLVGRAFALGRERASS